MLLCRRAMTKINGQSIYTQSTSTTLHLGIEYLNLATHEKNTLINWPRDDLHPADRQARCGGTPRQQGRGAKLSAAAA